MTYPEMNAEIVGLLRAGTTPVDKYAADRIEELERQRDELLESLTAMLAWFKYPNSCDIPIVSIDIWDLPDGFDNDVELARDVIARATAPDMPDVT